MLSVTPAASVRELLALHDDAFVRCAYLSVLGREADPAGFAHYLGRVRAGESRLAILAAMRLSTEGRQKNLAVAGLDRRIAPYRWRRTPVVGAVLRFLGAGRERFDVEREVAAIEAKLHRLALRAPALPAPAAAAETRIAPARFDVPLVQQPVLAPPPAETPKVEPVPAAPAAPAPAAPAAPAATLAQVPPPDPAIACLRWAIRRPLAAAGDEMVVAQDELVRALAAWGQEVVREADGVEADVTLAFAWDAPAGGERRGRPTIAVLGERTAELQPEAIAQVNAFATGVACASTRAAKTLAEHGLQVPASAVGWGLDHWDRVAPSVDLRAPGRALRLLHACDGQASGTDLLLNAYGRTFRADEDVTLVIEARDEDANSELRRWLEALRAQDAQFPDVAVVQGPLPAADRKALYQQCHAYLAPHRDDSAGLAIGEALVSGLPVVATASMGHLDFCNADSGWLLDYEFVRAESVGGRIGDALVEAQAASLEWALRGLRQASAEERAAKAAAGRERVLGLWTWRQAARRLVAFAEHVRARSAIRPRPVRLGWLTTWNVKCGIATHVEHAVAGMRPEQFLVFAARQNEARTRADDANCVRAWQLGKDGNGLQEVDRELEAGAVDALVVQFNYGFFNHRELDGFMGRTAARGIPVFLHLHSTVDPFGDTENFRLQDLAWSLRQCARVLVHTPMDMNRLKALGVIANVMLLPHGVMQHQHTGKTPVAVRDVPLLASFGFLLPNKGLPELVEAVALLRDQGRPVRLLMLNALHPDPVSREELAKLHASIARLGLQEHVEVRTEFLTDAECLDLLAMADLVVNPYQRTGESASGSARYGLAAGRPVAVTPLPFFDDLGDAVHRLPGIAPPELARGIQEVLEHLRRDSPVARRVRDTAAAWVAAHDYARQGELLLGMARALGKPRPLPRGAFVNTARASCSIHESGRMVFNCIRESEHYTLDYLSLDMFDVRGLAADGRVRRHGGGIEPPYDFWVFNWHFITMATELRLEEIQKLPGLKFTVILELEPGDPLKLIPLDVFDGYIALDPSAPATGKIYPFPRPLEGDPRQPGEPNAVPVIGSFGFGTPGKGFELVVEAVNREFDRAIVRVNVPRGDYTASMDAIHRQDYAKYIADLCRRIAKPGIEVRFTNDFMSPEQLVQWCGENDLNCFLYTRRQSGLSATTDQAIMSGRPLVTSSNDTFRHIHTYIPPYPVLSLREAIARTPPQVRRMQQDWSREAFRRTFEAMLADLGLLLPAAGVVAQDRGTPVRTVFVPWFEAPQGGLLDYRTRVADCLGRTGAWHVVRRQCEGPQDLETQLKAIRPDAVLLVEPPGVDARALVEAARRGASRVLLVRPGVAAPTADASVVALEKVPVIPYYTPFIASREDPPRIMLVGFSCEGSNLEEVVGRVARELPGAAVFMEVPQEDHAAFESRVAAMRDRLALSGVLHLIVQTMPVDGDKFLRAVVENWLTVFHNDPARTGLLEDMACLAMAAERPVAFTLAAPFAHFAEDGAHIEDVTLQEAVQLGMAAQIKLCHQFGEGAMFARLDSALSQGVRQVAGHAPPELQASGA